MSASDVYYQQTLNEIRICAKIGYHRNICTMLGYVSSERLTCLLLELADMSLFNAMETIKNELQENKQSIQDIVKYLIGIAIQIANGMVTKLFILY
jgi:serine/threonine protein kinase